MHILDPSSPKTWQIYIFMDYLGLVPIFKPRKRTFIGLCDLPRFTQCGGKETYIFIAYDSKEDASTLCFSCLEFIHESTCGPSGVSCLDQPLLVGCFHFWSWLAVGPPGPARAGWVKEEGREEWLALLPPAPPGLWITWRNGDLSSVFV